MSTKDYIVATIKPWNVAAFHRHAPTLPGRWHLASSPAELTALLARLTPRYVFFPHWSWKVPPALTDAQECVCFHMTDVPFGRGGSPLQNLIARGFTETRLTALRMVEELDAGPVYAKVPLSLAGTAQEIFERGADVVYELVRRIAAEEPTPTPQEGTPVPFERRTPAQSELPAEGSLARLHDHIRMLDAETYPPAFLDHGPFRIELTGSRLGDGVVEARARIVLRREGGER